MEPASLSDFLSEEETDNFGYVWRKQLKQHTLELVGYDSDKEIGAIVLEHDDSPEAHKRKNELSWVWDRANAISPDGVTLNIMKEAIRVNHDIYG